LQGKSTSFGITTKFYEEYRHDAEKRDFVACGSAAGVAAAFGSPSKSYDHELRRRRCKIL
jgi:hypothetical protein